MVVVEVAVVVVVVLLIGAVATPDETVWVVWVVDVAVDSAELTTVAVVVLVVTVVEVWVVVDVWVTGTASWLQAELRTSGEKVARSDGVLMGVEDELCWRATSEILEAAVTPLSTSL